MAEKSCVVTPNIGCFPSIAVLIMLPRCCIIALTTPDMEGLTQVWARWMKGGEGRNKRNIAVPIYVLRINKIDLSYWKNNVDKVKA